MHKSSGFLYFFFKYNLWQKEPSAVCWLLLWLPSSQCILLLFCCSDPIIMALFHFKVRSSGSHNFPAFFPPRSTGFHSSVSKYKLTPLLQLLRDTWPVCVSLFWVLIWTPGPELSSAMTQLHAGERIRFELASKIINVTEPQALQIVICCI